MNQPVRPESGGAAAPKTWAHHVARWSIRPLVHTPVTPNHLTSLRLLTGVAAAAAFAVGDYVWGAWGGGLFVISTMLDRADGELARLSGRTTPGGHRYDLFCDAVVNVLLFVGIGIGLAGGVLGAWALVLGLIAGVAVGTIFAVVALLHSAGSSPREAFGWRRRFDLDDILFMVGPMAWFDALPPLLWAAAVGAPAFLVFALWRFRGLGPKS